MQDQELLNNYADDEDSIDSSDTSSSSDDSESASDSSVVSSSSSESNTTGSDEDTSSSSDSEYDETTDGESSALPDTDNSSSEPEDDTESSSNSESSSESESEETATEKSGTSEEDESEASEKAVEKVGKKNQAFSRKPAKTTVRKRQVESSESTDSDSSASDKDESESESSEQSSKKVSKQAKKETSNVEKVTKRIGSKKGKDQGDAKDESGSSGKAEKTQRKSEKEADSDDESDESLSEDSSSSSSEDKREKDEELVPASPIKPLSRRSSISSALQEPGSPTKMPPKPELEDDVSIGTVDTAAVLETMQEMMDQKMRPTEDTIPEDPEQEEGTDMSRTSDKENTNAQVDSVISELKQAEPVDEEHQVQQDEAAEKEELQPEKVGTSESEKNEYEDIEAPNAENADIQNGKADSTDPKEEKVLIPDSTVPISKHPPEKKKRGLFSRLRRSRSESKERDRLPPARSISDDSVYSSKKENTNVLVDSSVISELTQAGPVDEESQVRQDEAAEKEELQPEKVGTSESEKNEYEDVEAQNVEARHGKPDGMDPEEEKVLIPDSTIPISEQPSEKKKRGLFSRLRRSRSESKERDRLSPPRSISVDSAFSQEEIPKDGEGIEKRGFLKQARSRSRERTPLPLPSQNKDTNATRGVSSEVDDEPKLAEAANNIEIPEEFENAKVEGKAEIEEIGGQTAVQETEEPGSTKRVGATPSADESVSHDDSSRAKPPRGLFSFLRRNIIGEKRPTANEVGPDAAVATEERRFAESENKRVETKDIAVENAASEIWEQQKAPQRAENQQNLKLTEANNVALIKVVPQQEKDNDRPISWEEEEEEEEEEKEDSESSEPDNSSESSMGKEKTMREVAISSENVAAAEPVSEDSESSESSESSKASNSNAAYEKELSGNHSENDDKPKAEVVSTPETSTVPVVPEKEAPETAAVESRSVEPDQDQESKAVKQAVEVSKESDLVMEPKQVQDNETMKQAMKVSKEADVVERNELAPEKPKKKGFNFLQMMKLRRQMADNETDDSTTKEKGSPKKAPQATMSSDLQAIMNRRRKLAEARDADVPDPVVERKATLKKSSMNAEMEAILQRRREAEEELPKHGTEVHETGHTKETEADSHVASEIEKASESIASESEELSQSMSSESEEVSESVESEEELEVVEEEEEEEEEEVSESEPSCEEVAELDEEMGIIEAEPEFMEEADEFIEEDIIEEEEILEEVVEEEFVEEIDEEEIVGYPGQTSYDVEAPKEQSDSRFVVPVYLSQEAPPEPTYSRSVNDETFQTTDDEMASYDIETGSMDAPNEQEAKQHGEEEKEEGEKPRFSKRCVILVALILLVVGVCGGIGLGILLAGDDSSDKTLPNSPTQEPTMAPSQAPTPIVDPEIKEYYDLICPRIENCNALFDTETPQGKAFKWLVEENELLSFYTEEKIVQRYALATFYFSTNGDSWLDNSNWLSNADECQWYSTSPARSCAASKEFVSLELDNNNVHGNIPFELGLLTTLTSLSLQNAPGSQGLQGTWPNSLGKLIELRSVKLSGNSFSGSIPSQVGEWVNVHTIVLSHNEFTGEVPAFFAALVQLVSLNLAGNKLTGSFPSIVLTTANGLKNLRLEGNQLSSLPASIKGLTFLQELNIANNMLSDFPLEVTELASLTSLDMQQNKIAKAIPTQIGNLFALKELYLNGNGLVGSIPTEIGNLVSLKTSLDLSSNNLTGNIPSEIGKITKLRRLFLTSNKLSGEVPAELASMNKINTIRIDDNDLTGIIPTEVCTLYETLKPASYADCTEIISLCFNYCCTDGQGCQCRYENTDPLRCLAKG